MERPVRLAYDGGQSGLRICAFEPGPDGSAIVLARAAVDGFSWVRGGDPVEQQAERVIAGWVAIGSPPSIDVVATGLSAGGSFAADRMRLCGILGEALPTREIRATGDDVVAHLGALSGRAGVTLAAGTGTLCLAIGAEGRRLNVDGLGYLFGDEGGGFWLGRAGMRAALQAAEGRGPATALQSALRDRVGPLPQSVKHLYTSPTLVADVASFAAEVDEAAVAGDAVALAICREAAEGLCGDVGVAIRFLAETDVTGPDAADPDAADPTASFPVALGGGVLRSGGVVREELAGLLTQRCPRAAVTAPDGDASDGAMELAGPRHHVHHDMAVTWRRGGGIVGVGSPDQLG